MNERIARDALTWMVSPVTLSLMLCTMTSLSEIDIKILENQLLDLEDQAANLRDRVEQSLQDGTTTTGQLHVKLQKAEKQRVSTIARTEKSFACAN